MYTIRVPGFSMWNTYRSCQSLRMRQYMILDDVSYLVIHRDMACQVRQRGDRIIMTGSEEDFYDVWFRYFDMSRDYQQLDREAASVPGYVGSLAKERSGVRMLDLDPMEALLTQLVWFRCDSETARARLSNVCQAVGCRRKKYFKGLGSVEWDEIPSPQEILDSQDSLKWFCDSRTEQKAVDLAVFLECHDELLEPEARGDLKYVMSLLMSSGLYNANQARRVLRDGYGAKHVDCMPRRFRSRCMRSSYADTWESYLEWELDCLGDAKSYPSLLVQTMV